MRLAVRKAGVLLDGPTDDAQAEGTDFIKGHDIDAAGNVYWSESNSPVIRSYRAKTGRVITLAGSVRGLRDGPLESARFGGWWYNATNLLCVSDDGEHLFVVDRGAGNLWRYVDLEAGVVRTIGPLHDKASKTTLCIVKDRRGGIYALTGQGKPAPQCKGYRSMSVTLPSNFPWYSVDRWALNAGAGKLYYHTRNAPHVIDLQSGEDENLTPPGDNPRKPDLSGPFLGMTWHCPTGMSISPGGRYLFMGGGDSNSFYRLDLKKRHIFFFVKKPDGTYGYEDGFERDEKCRLSMWPAAGVFNANGNGAWASSKHDHTDGGIYLITPVDGQE